jgi:hypothetical protein
MAPSGYTYYKTETVNHLRVSEDLSYFVMLIKESSDTNVGSRCRIDGYDVLFTLNDGVTLLKFQRSYFNITGGAASYIFHVQIPALSSSSDTVIRMYYGNSSQTTDPQTTNGGTWDDGGNNYYKGVWHLQEAGTNPIAIDSSPNGQNSSSQTWTPSTQGKIGNCASFNGSQGISFANFSQYMSNAPLTIEGWIKSNTIGVYTGAFGINASYERNTFCIKGAGSTAIQYKYGDSDANQWTIEPDLNIESWTHVVFTRNGSDLIAYANASVIGSDATASGVINSNTGTFGIGTVGVYYWRGLIDEVRVSNIARSAGWIETEYANQNSPSTFYTLGAETAETAGPTVIEISSTVSTVINSTANIKLTKFISSSVESVINETANSTIIKPISSSNDSIISSTANILKKLFISSSNESAISETANISKAEFISSSSETSLNSTATINVQSSGLSVAATTELSGTANVSVKKFISSNTTSETTSWANIFKKEYISSSNEISLDSTAEIYLETSDLSINASLSITSTANASIHKFISSSSEISASSTAHAVKVLPITSSVNLEISETANSLLSSFISSNSPLVITETANILKHIFPSSNVPLILTATATVDGGTPQGGNFKPPLTFTITISRKSLSITTPEKSLSVTQNNKRMTIS